jgi:hypothetical protein
MSGLVLIFFLAIPRIALVLVYNNTYDIQHAYHAFHFPLYGFLFLPLTTLVYAWMVNAGDPMAGYGLLIMICTVAIDLGSLISAAFHRGD